MSPPNNDPRFRILCLVCVHLFASLFFLAVTHPSTSAPMIMIPLRTGLILSQASLLGIWVEAGRGRWWLRLLGCLICVGWLGPPVALVLAAVAALLFVARCYGVYIHRDADEASPRATPQFSIRHLLILTLVVACLLTLGRSVAPGLISDAWFQFALVAAPFAVIGIVAIWAILTPKHPAARIALLFVIATMAGLGASRITWGYDWSGWLIATSTQALLLVVSLLIIRSSGFHLRRWPAPEQPGGDRR